MGLSRLPHALPVLCGLLILATTPSAKPSPAEVPVSTRIIISCRTDSPEDFEKLATLAQELGATHLDISDLPKDRWQWWDPNDPYPNWSMLVSGILKIMVPPELQPAIPTGNALRSQKILAQRGDILRQHGLKADFHGSEPMWLPDAVYKEHPSWRGPRCQSPIRSRHDYFAPCIDQPEVLSLYRKATADLCKLVPIEEFSFLVNDSGSGVCWHPGLYPGPNGPDFCKDRPMADRLNGFMAALRDGAKEAGLDATVHFAGSQMLEPGGLPSTVSASASDYFWSSKCYPIVAIPDPVQFAADLERVFASPGATWKFGIPSLEFTSYFDLIRLFRAASVKGPLARAQALNTAASHIAGDAAAPALVQAWQDIHDAILLLADIDNGGPILLLGSVNQRWLVRPLVPFPLELPPAEKDYYRRFQFQAQTEQDAANLMNLQGLFAISGDAGTALASALFHDAGKHLKSAHEQLQSVLAANADNKEITALDSRLQAFILVIRNADLTARYQAFLERFKPGWNARPDKNGYPVPEEGEKIVQADIANTKDLLTLLRSTSIPLIQTAPTPEEEDVFQFGPDLTGQLEKKIAIEWEHLPAHQRLLHP